mmetsp:Transcript_15864/g.28159  ORF Transcript_15864/g.28159 Transcript_15864/m.28159 type:complete len:321 (+) Transcript_15864:1046-2008(+)
MVNLILHLADLEGLLQQRHLLLALGPLKVVHLLRQACELALQLLPLLQLLRQSLVHQSLTINLFTLLEDTALLASSLHERLGFLQFSRFHFTPDALLLALQPLRREALLLRLLVNTRLQQALLFLLLLVLQHALLLLLLPSLDDHLTRDGQLVLLLHRAARLRGKRRRLGHLLPPRVGVDHRSGLAHALGQQRQVRLHLLLRQLTAAKVEGAGAVVQTKLEVAILDGVHNDELHLGQLHKWHQRRQLFNLDHAVHLTQLVAHAQHRQLAQVLFVVPKRDLRNGGSRRHGAANLVQARNEGLDLVAQLQRVEVRFQQLVDL